MKTAFCIFSRANSKRFRSKYCSAKINGIPLLEYILQNAQKSIPANSIVILTGDDPSCDPIALIAEKYDISVLRGSEEFPVLRLYQSIPTLIKKQFTHICRICGDSPYYPFKDVSRILESSMIIDGKTSSEHCLANTLPKTYPNGISIEIYPIKCLLNTLNDFPSLLYVDSLTNVIQKQKQFIQMSYSGSDNVCNYPLTIDTYEDLDVSEKNYKWLKSIHFFEDLLLKSSFIVKSNT